MIEPEDLLPLVKAAYAKHPARPVSVALNYMKYSKNAKLTGEPLLEIFRNFCVMNTRQNNYDNG